MELFQERGYLKETRDAHTGKVRETIGPDETLLTNRSERIRLDLGSPEQAEVARGIFSAYLRSRPLLASGTRGDPHAWRHGFAISLIMQGKPLEVVKELLGRSSIPTTHIHSRAPAANVRPFMERTEL